MKQTFQLTLILLVTYLSPLVRADTDEATKALSPAAMMEIIKSLSESVKSLSETVKTLSESSEPATKADHTPTKESTATTATENKGLSFKGEFDDNFMPLLLEVTLPKLKKSNPLYQVEVQDLAFHLNTDTQNSLGLALSNMSFKLGHFKINTKLLGLNTTLENLDFTLKGEISEDVVNYGWQTKLEKLLIPGTANQGKALNLSYVSQVDLQRVDAAALVALQTTVHELSKQFQEGTLSEAELNSTLAQKANDLLPQLLAKSPEVTISKLQLTSPDGQLQGSATISIDGEKPISLENEDELQKSLLEALTIQADVSLSKNLLIAGLKLGEDHNVVEEKIQTLLAEKILVESEEDTYQSTMSLEDGKLTINGEVEDLRLHFMKEKVAEAIELLTSLQKPAEEYLAKEKSFPEIEKLGGKTSGKYVASIISAPKQFYFQATMKEASKGIEREIAGKTVKMVFDQENKNWYCAPGEEEGIETQYLPESCQAQEEAE